MTLTISELGLPAPMAIDPLVSTDEAVRLLRERDLRHLVVTDRDEASGILCDLDLVESVAMLLRAERRALEGTIETEEVFVADVMDTDAPAISLDTPALDAAHLLLDEKRAALPVLSEGRMVGLVSDDLLIRAYARPRGLGEPGPQAEAVLNHGSRVTRTLKPSDTLRTACARLARGRLRHLPVLERERFVGFVSDRDIARFIGMAGRDWPQRTVAEMGPVKAPTLRPRDSLARAAELMRAQKLMALPIISRDGLLVSLLTATDLLSALVSALAVQV